MKKLTILSATLALLLTACGASDGAGSDTTETTPPASAPGDPGTTAAPEATVPIETTRAGEEGAPGVEFEDKVAVAISDLAGRIGADPADIVVQTAEDVTWRDGSLGCPLPGMSYTQALVDGVRIVLEVDGDLYHYHSSVEKEPFFCAEPAEPLGGESGDG